MAFEEILQAAEAGESALVSKPQPRGRGLGLGRQVVVVELGEIDEAAIMAEIIVPQLRKAIEAKALDHQPIEMTDEEVGQEERAELLRGDGGEILRAGEEFIAMRAGNSLDSLLRQHAIELAAGAAIAIETEDVVVLCAILGDLAAHLVGDALRTIVQFGRQAGHLDMAERAALQENDLARQRAAGDDERAASGFRLRAFCLHHSAHWPGPAAARIDALA